MDLWRRGPEATWRRTGAVERCRELGKRMEEESPGAVGPWRHWEVRLRPHRESHRGAGKGILGKGNRDSTTFSESDRAQYHRRAQVLLSRTVM